MTTEQTTGPARGQAGATHPRAGQLLLAVSALGGACIGVSLLAFRLRWGVWPEAVDVVMSFITAPIAWPISFAWAIGVNVSAGGVKLLLFVVTYWLIMFWLVQAAWRRRTRTACAALAGFSLATSLYWQDVTSAILGI